MDSAHTPIPPQPPRGAATRALIEAIVPAPAVAVDTREDLDEELLPGELEHVARAVPSRRAEFATGRACARLALGRLGLPARAIPPGQRGEPRWPRGIVGSITHCAGYRGAVIARASQIAGIGIDAEPNGPLPAGVLSAISLPPERAWVDRLSATHPAVHWDRLLFCIKESVYKAWYPLAHRWLDFEDAAVAVEPERGRFTAKLRIAGPDFQGRELSEFSGRWLVADGLILTAIVVSHRVERPIGTAAVAGAGAVRPVPVRPAPGVTVPRPRPTLG